MPWVCSCGQRNIIDGLPCLACDRTPEIQDNQAPKTPARTGFRFREEPVEPPAEEGFDQPVDQSAEQEIPSQDDVSTDAELENPARRFRFAAPAEHFESDPLIDAEFSAPVSSLVPASADEPSGESDSDVFATGADGDVVALGLPSADAEVLEDPGFEDLVAKELPVADEAVEEEPGPDDSEGSEDEPVGRDLIEDSDLEDDRPGIELFITDDMIEQWAMSEVADDEPPVDWEEFDQAFGDDPVVFDSDSEDDVLDAPLSVFAVEVKEEPEDVAEDVLEDEPDNEVHVFIGPAVVPVAESEPASVVESESVADVPSDGAPVASDVPDAPMLEDVPSDGAPVTSDVPDAPMLDAGGGDDEGDVGDKGAESSDEKLPHPVWPEFDRRVQERRRNGRREIDERFGKYLTSGATASDESIVIPAFSDEVPSDGESSTHDVPDAPMFEEVSSDGAPVTSDVPDAPMLQGLSTPVEEPNDLQSEEDQEAALAEFAQAVEQGVPLEAQAAIDEGTSQPSNGESSTHDVPDAPMHEESSSNGETSTHDVPDAPTLDESSSDVFEEVELPEASDSDDFDDIDEDPWAAFQRALEEEAAKTESQQLELPSAEPTARESTASEPTADASSASEADNLPEPIAPIDKPVFAQPVEEFEVPEFEVPEFTPEELETEEPIIDEVLKADPFAANEEFERQLADNASNDQPSGKQDEPFDHDWTRWALEAEGVVDPGAQPKAAETQEPTGVPGWPDIPEIPEATSGPAQSPHSAEELPWADGDPWDAVHGGTDETSAPIPQTPTPAAPVPPVGEPEDWTNSWAGPIDKTPSSDLSRESIGEPEQAAEPEDWTDPWARHDGSNDPQLAVDEDPWAAAAGGQDPWEVTAAQTAHDPNLDQLYADAEYSGPVDDPWAEVADGEDDWNVQPGAPRQTAQAPDDYYDQPDGSWDEYAEPQGYGPEQADQYIQTATGGTGDQPWWEGQQGFGDDYAADPNPNGPSMQEFEDGDSYDAYGNPSAYPQQNDQYGDLPWSDEDFESDAYSNAAAQQDPYADQYGAGYGTPQSNAYDHGYGDGYDEDPYAPQYQDPQYQEPTRGRAPNRVPSRPPSEFFDDDVDLDAPDPYEVDEWALPDEPVRPRSRQAGDRGPRRPGGSRERGPRGDRRPPSRGGRKRGGQNSPLRAPFGSGSTAITILVIAIAIIALSLLFKTAFQSVGATADPSAEAAQSCSENSGNTTTPNFDLAAALVESIDGMTRQADHLADTGAIDFTRALAAEPDPSNALNVLDQSRFEKGHDRKFQAKKAGELYLATYEFKGSACAQNFVSMHKPAESAQTFGVDRVNGSVGEVVKTGTKQYTVYAYAPVADRVVIVKWTGATNADVARSTVQNVAAKQVEILATVGKDGKKTTTTVQKASGSSRS